MTTLTPHHCRECGDECPPEFELCDACQLREDEASEPGDRDYQDAQLDGYLAHRRR